ncbi:MAG: hypothetical protein LBL73_07415 [Synergistaceae bacterium]|jgi:hypothetical protein|nr:hypothetical protein [Synergistaceae bacterium]
MATTACKVKVFGMRFSFLFMTAFMLAVLTLSIPFCYRASQASVGDFRGASAVFVPASGVSKARTGEGAFWGVTADRLHIDIYTDSSNTHDYQKAVWRYQSEIDRRTAREAESASLRVRRNMLKTYEREYIRSVSEGGSCAAGRSVQVRNWLKAIERILPS